MFFKEAFFVKAKPVYGIGCSTETNCPMIFEANIPKCGKAYLRISGHTGYQVFIGGRFVHFGPARAGRGYYRVDLIDISRYLESTDNSLKIISSGYYCDSFEWLKEPSFIAAEVIADGEVILYTGGTDFACYPYSQKISRVQRYSFQRPFAEVYDMGRDVGERIAIENVGDRKFIEREISYPEFPREMIKEIYAFGTVGEDEPEKYYADRAIVNAGGAVDGFPPDKTEVISIHKAQRLKLYNKANVEKSAPGLPFSLESNTYFSAAMRVNTTGFIALSVRALTDTELYLTFDEILTEGEVDFTRNSTSNVILYKLKGSVDYHLVTMAPYTFKYINVISVGGRAEVSYLGMIRTDFNASEITRELDKSCADDVTERIYGAAIETFRQNTFDIFMDCPSRERAGWLCDSFFTARVERLLTGKNTVERCFLSNFLMEENYKGIPSGMLPMCYPSEFRTPEYIPNWAMWYLLELREYEKRTKDGALVSAAEGKMRALCSYFEKYENSDGLLEGLDGWVFVEWSMCNKLVQDVNYPSNMLYCMFLKTMYELYGDEKYFKKASSLRELIRQRSRMGLFFCDNSVRRDGVLTLSGECTETCQYYAFFTGVATPEEDSELWQTMVRDFGPGRAESGLWANIHPSNAFIGNYLRLELLAKNKIYDKLEADIRGYFDYMAKRTGTLWEHTNVNASCNHGFASHVLVWLDMLGYII